MLHYITPVLPGLEEYVITASSGLDKRDCEYHRDLYNLRLLKGLKASNRYGLPTLTGYDVVSVSNPIAFHEARSLYRDRKSLRGFFVHFYVGDERFECVRRFPDKYTPMLKSADFISGPDFSTYSNYPFPVIIKNAYDNMLLAAYYERQGVKVVPNVTWSRPMFYDITFSGQPTGKPICISSKSVARNDKRGQRLWLHGYKEAIVHLSPSMVIRIGRIIPGEDDIYPNPVRVEVDNPYIMRLRNGR